MMTICPDIPDFQVNFFWLNELTPDEVFPETNQRITKKWYLEDYFAFWDGILIFAGAVRCAAFWGVSKRNFRDLDSI